MSSPMPREKDWEEEEEEPEVPSAFRLVVTRLADEEEPDVEEVYSELVSPTETAATIGRGGGQPSFDDFFAKTPRQSSPSKSSTRGTRSTARYSRLTELKQDHASTPWRRYGGASELPDHARNLSDPVAKKLVLLTSPDHEALRLEANHPRRTLRSSGRRPRPSPPSHRKPLARIDNTKSPLSNWMHKQDKSKSKSKSRDATAKRPAPPPKACCSNTVAPDCGGLAPAQYLGCS